MLQASFFILSIYTRSALAQGVNHANRHAGWQLGGGPYFCGTDADGDGTEFLAAVLGPKCGATIWIKNTGTYGPSVNNGIGNCITAKLVDQEGGGSVDLNPTAWTALSNAPPGQVSVEWYAHLDEREPSMIDAKTFYRGYGSCGDSDSKPAQDSSSSNSDSDGSSTESESLNASSDNSSNESSNSDDPSTKSSSDSSSDSSRSEQEAQSTSGDSCSVQANDRCGGKDFNGCTTCADDMECFFFNEGQPFRDSHGLSRAWTNMT
ncbi:MAG: hypothetical protein Q9204_000605 [Flavoplaca sp. TL-2023a]